MSDSISIDGETLFRLRHGGPTGADELAARAATDAALSEQLAEWDRQDAALRALYGSVAEQPVPARHRALIEAAETAPQRGPSIYLRIAAMVALVAFGVVGGWAVARVGQVGPAGTGLVSQAFRAHATYAVEVVHPVEVPGSDLVHLTAWLSKRLGYPITPPNLEAKGFRLMGGRVVPDANGTAALMMYEDNLGRRVTLYVAPDPSGAETALRFADDGATNGFWWFDENLRCALVGALPRDVLRALSMSAYGQITRV